MSPRAAIQGYGQLCGVATGLDMIGDRWAPLIIRDLLLGPLRFNDLAQGLPGIGTNTLTRRLKHLEDAGVVARGLLPVPERGTAYELTPYGRELEPIFLALGRWGTRSMGRLPAEVAMRSRWLATAMLAFHDQTHQIATPTTWELRLTDGVFSVRAERRDLAISAGPPARADLVVSTDDMTLHAMLCRQISPADAVASGQAVLDGDETALAALLDLFAFPPAAVAARSGGGSGKIEP
jgi:DNA-binding HxlR family transcriptional regulator